MRMLHSTILTLEGINIHPAQRGLPPEVLFAVPNPPRGIATIAARGIMIIDDQIQEIEASTPLEVIRVIEHLTLAEIAPPLIDGADPMTKFRMIIAPAALTRIIARLTADPEIEVPPPAVPHDRPANTAGTIPTTKIIIIRIDPRLGLNIITKIIGAAPHLAALHEVVETYVMGNEIIIRQNLG